MYAAGSLSQRSCTAAAAAGQSLLQEYILLQAHFHKEAAQLLLQLAKSETASHAPPLRIKKLYLLAALEVDQLKARMLNIGEQPGTGSPGKAGGASTGTAAAAHTLAGEKSMQQFFQKFMGQPLSVHCLN